MYAYCVVQSMLGDGHACIAKIGQLVKLWQSATVHRAAKTPLACCFGGWHAMAHGMVGLNHWVQMCTLGSYCRLWRICKQDYGIARQCAQLLGAAIIKQRCKFIRCMSTLCTALLASTCHSWAQRRQTGAQSTPPFKHSINPRAPAYISRHSTLHYRGLLALHHTLKHKRSPSAGCSRLATTTSSSHQSKPLKGYDARHVGGSRCLAGEGARVSHRIQAPLFKRGLKEPWQWFSCTSLSLAIPLMTSWLR